MTTGSSGAPDRRISTSRRILFVAVLAAMSIAVGEVATRVLGLAPDMLPLEITTGNATFVASPNPRLGWYPKPGSADVNADGFRDRAYPVAKGPRVFRIEVLGDSVAFGACVTSRDETFSKVIERDLDAYLGRVEVMNLGVPGYDTEQEVELLKERGLRYSPDLVLVGVCLNDFDSVAGAGPMAVLAERQTLRGRMTAALRRRLLMSSHLFRVCYGRLATVRPRPSIGAGATRSATAAATDSNPVTNGFAELAELARVHGFGVVVAVFPVFSPRSRPDMVALAGRVVDLAEAHGWKVIDLAAAYGDVSRDPRAVSCDPLHPNTTGHRIAGEFIARALATSPELFGERASEARERLRAARAAGIR